MATLFQMLMNKFFKKNTPFKFDTPIQELDGHHTMMIDLGQYRNKFFKLEFCRKLTFKINSVNYDIFDYYFERKSENDAYLVLRLLPKEDGSYSYLLLERVSECAYDEEFYTNLCKNQEYEDGGNQYWRVDDSEKEYIASVKEISYQGNSYPQERDVDNYSISQWDFWRQTTANSDENSQKYIEYYYIEMSQEDGWFSFLVGQEIPKSLITFIKD